MNAPNFAAWMLVLLMPLNAGAADTVFSDFALSPPETGSATGGVQSAYERSLRLATNGAPPSAMMLYGRILTAIPTHSGAQHMMGLCCWVEGNTEDAFRYLVLATRGTNVSPRTYLALSALCAQGGGAAESAGWLKKALPQLSPLERQAWLARDYFKSVRSSQAFEDLFAEEPPATTAPDDQEPTSDKTR
jgi:hypothetical protein